MFTHTIYKDETKTETKISFISSIIVLDLNSKRRGRKALDKKGETHKLRYPNFQF